MRRVQGEEKTPSMPYRYRRCTRGGAGFSTIVCSHLGHVSVMHAVKTTHQPAPAVMRR